MKKIIIALIIFFTVFIGLEFYNSRKTIECWWGVAYPTLSFIAFEDEDEDTARISSLNSDYIYVKEYEEKPVKIKIAIVEWFKKYFGKE